MKIDLSKHYNLLKVKERVNISLAALARGDDEELLKLKNNCQMLTYKMHDADYIYGMEKIIIICATYIYMCEVYSNKVNACGSLILIFRQSISAYEAGFNLMLEDLDDSYKPSKKIIAKKNKKLKEYGLVIDEMNICFNERVGELSALREALKDFCGNAGINYQYINDFVKRLTDFELMDGLSSENIEIDTEFKNKMEKLFSDFWNN